MPSPRVLTNVLAAIAACIAPMAAGQVAVSPPLVEASVSPRRTEVVRVTVANLGNDPRELRARLSGLAVTADGRPADAGDQEPPRSCRSWLAVEPESATVGARQSLELALTVAVPADASGGYSALLTLDLAAPTGVGPQGFGGTIRLGHRLVVPVILNARGLRPVYPQVAIAELSILSPDELSPEVKDRVKDKQGALIAAVTNTGAAHVRLGGEAVLRTASGARLSTVPFAVGMGYVLAGCERHFVAGLDWPLPDGVYILGANLRPYGGHRTVVSRSQPAAVQNGTMLPGEVTDELRKTLEALSPSCIMQPDELCIDVSPGGKASAAVRFYRLCEQPLTLEPRPYLWSLDEDGDVTFQVPADPAQRGEQLSLRPARIDLSAARTRSAAVVCSRPKGVSGELYAALVFARPDEELPDDPHELLQRAVLVSTAPRGTGVPQLVIRQVTREDAGSAGQRLAVTVANEGTRQAQVSIGLSVALDGQLLEELPAFGEPVRILAGGVRVARISWPRLLQPGHYSLTAHGTYMQGDQPATVQGSAEFDVSAP